MIAELVAFLHARYDEAEERYEADAGSDTEERRAVLAERPNRWDVIVVHDAVHHLADLASKRAIVNEVSGWANNPRSATWILKQLASPYADHADYRPEWKPDQP